MTWSFNPESHTYIEGKEVVPSVTQIMTMTGISDVNGIPLVNLERARQRGDAVHQACQFLDEGDLDLESLDPEIVGYVVGYQKFREQFGFKPELIEHRMIAHAEEGRYGMCLDRLGTLADGSSLILDIKTSSKASPSWPIQTAAYVYGHHHDSLGGDIIPRAVVHLSKEGTFKLLRHDDPLDFRAWRSALTLAHWMLENGYKIKNR